MKYAIDTEFFENGPKVPVKLISLGIAAEDGRSLYLINKDFSWNTVPKNHWLWENVKPHLFIVVDRGLNHLLTYSQMKAKLLAFFRDDPKPEFWGYYADYDWVLFCQIFGTMVELPSHFPKMCLDVNQERISWNLGKDVFPKQSTVEHNALNDAKWTLDCVNTLWLHKKKTLDRLYLGGV